VPIFMALERSYSSRDRPSMQTVGCSDMHLQRGEASTSMDLMRPKRVTATVRIIEG